jgi:hypothetical protein
MLGPAHHRASSGRHSSLPVVAATGLVAGVFFTVRASSNRNEVADLRERIGSAGCGEGTPHTADCDAAGDLVSSYERNVRRSRAGWIVAGAAGAAAGALFVWPPPWGREVDVALRIEPFGVGVVGAF